MDKLMEVFIMRGWFPVILITAALALGGCGDTQLNDDIQTTAESDENQSTSAISEETSNDINYITDWSLDELVQNIELNGKSYSMPFTVEDLGEGYTIGEKISLSGDTYGYNLYYNDKYYALIKLNLNNIITSITFSDNVNFKIGELYSGNSKEKIINVYGIPSVEARDIIATYLFSNGNSISIFYEDNKLESISINYYIEEE